MARTHGLRERRRCATAARTLWPTSDDMRELEQLLGLFLAAVLLAGWGAPRRGAVSGFLALGGALLAFLPGTPSFTLPPDLVLALFVAPVLLDAAYDASPRDLKDNWAPVTGLVVFAVGFTTVAVAVVARTLIPTMPWAPAIVLGAVVAPPDAAAATAVLRPAATAPSHPDDPRRRKPAERRQRAPDLPPRRGSRRGEQLLRRRSCSGLPARGRRQRRRWARRSGGSPCG